VLFTPIARNRNHTRSRVRNLILLLFFIFSCFRLITNLFLVLYQIGSSCIYVVFIASNLKAVSYGRCWLYTWPKLCMRRITNVLLSRRFRLVTLISAGTQTYGCIWYTYWYRSYWSLGWGIWNSWRHSPPSPLAWPLRVSHWSFTIFSARLRRSPTVNQLAPLRAYHYFSAPCFSLWKLSAW